MEKRFRKSAKMVNEAIPGLGYLGLGLELLPLAGGALLLSGTLLGCALLHVKFVPVPRKRKLGEVPI